MGSIKYNSIASVIQNDIPEQRQKFLASSYAPWPVRSLQEHLGSLRPQIIMFAALPGNGKTTFGVWLWWMLASANDYKALYIAGEPSAIDVALAMAAQKAGISRSDLREWKVSGDDLNAIQAIADERWANENALIVETPTVDDAISATAAMGRLEHPRKVIIVDYVQYLDPRGGESATDALERLSKAFVEARRNDVTVIALAQLNHAASDKKRPSIHDVHWAKRIPKDADVGAILKIEEDPSLGPVLLVDIQKARGGRWSEAPLPVVYNELTGAFNEFEVRTVDLDALDSIL